MADNPFAQPSKLAFELPLFDRIRDSDYLPAFEAGMREQLEEVSRIAHNREPATLDNTIVALERSGQLLKRVEMTFSRLNACNTDPEMQRIDTEMAPRLTAQEDAIHLDTALWARVDGLYNKRTSLHLDPESLQLLSRYHTEFVRAGARLTKEQKTHLRDLNKSISSLTTRFKQNVLKATADGAVAVDSVHELDGLSPEQRRAFCLYSVPTLPSATSKPLVGGVTAGASSIPHYILSDREIALIEAKRKAMARMRAAKRFVRRR